MNTQKYNIGINDIIRRINEQKKEIEQKYIDVYSKFEKPFNEIFPYLHQQFNYLIDFLDKKSEQPRQENNEIHYNAAESRLFIYCINILVDLKKACENNCPLVLNKN